MTGYIKIKGIYHKAAIRIPVSSRSGKLLSTKKGNKGYSRSALKKETSRLIFKERTNKAKTT